jgi:replicative DNA helicase
MCNLNLHLQTELLTCDLKEPIRLSNREDIPALSTFGGVCHHQMERGIDLLIVDYLQLIEVPDRTAGENRTQQLTYISKRLKHVARDLHCPVVALSQLTRQCEQRIPPIPQLSDIRESGAIEQDADSVVMLYRQGFYNPDCDDPLETELYLRKNRKGPTGVVAVRFNPERMTFEPLNRRNLPSVLESPHPRQ